MTDGPKIYIKFRGMNAAGEDLPTPQLGDIMDVSVKAECVSVATEKRADGERRPVIGMKVIEVEPGEITKAPKEEGLFAVPNDDSDDDGTEV